MKIYVIRHGETDANKQGIFQGWSDYPLNEYGIKLAKETEKGMKDIPFDICFSSPLSRAKLTAEIVINGKCPIIFDDRLKEISAGDMELTKFSEVTDEKLLDNYHRFKYDMYHYEAMPNGEDAFDVMKRTQEFLNELIKKDYETVLVSTHGCALRCMLNCLYEDKTDFWQGRIPLNCAVSIVDVKDGQMKLIESDKIYYDESLIVDHFKR